MKETFSFLLFLFIGVLSPLVAQEITPIKDTYALPVETIITIEGVINSPDYGFNHGQFFLQDATGGLNVFFPNVGGEQGAITNYDEGDTVRIQGQTGSFAQVIQIEPRSISNGIEIIGNSDEIPAPILITASDLDIDSEYQGMRVEIKGVTLNRATEWPTTRISSSSGTNVSARVDGKDFVIRIDRGQSFFDGSSIPEEPFTLIGILSRFNNDVQIYPFFEGDIFQETTTNTFEALKLDNNIKIYPNPVVETITLEVLPQAGTVDRVVLFDLLGRTVAQYGKLNARNQTLSLPLPQSVQAGQYFLSVWTENGIRASKLMAIER